MAATSTADMAAAPPERESIQDWLDRQAGRLFILPAVVLILDHRRLAKRMDAAQLGRREHGLLVSLVAPDLVRKFELLQHPQHTLRARVLEVMDDDGHAGSPAARAVQIQAEAGMATRPFRA